MPIIVRPDGDTDLLRATIYDETAPPQTITELRGDEYEVGRVVWAPAVTVTEPIDTPGDVPWADVVQHMAQQFTSGSLQGNQEDQIPLDVVAPDVPFGSANNWGGHKIVSETGLSFDWTKWDKAVSELDAVNLNVLTAIPHAWPKASIFVSPAYTPVAADWKESLEAYCDQLVQRPGSDTIKYFRAMNETINPGTGTGTYENLWAEAASEDTDWINEGLDPRLWWTYSAAKGARTFPSARVFVNDYYIGATDGSAMGWGESDMPPEMTIADFQHQRFYIMVDQLHDALALAELTGTGEIAGSGELLEGLRIDGVGFQSHFKAISAICEEDIKWQLWEISGALDLGVYLSEINTKITDSGNLSNILSGSAAMDEFAAQVTAVRLNMMLSYSNLDNRMWTFWTKFTDEGENQALTLYGDGEQTIMYDKIRDLVNNPPTPVVKRAAMTNFHGPGRALMPIQVQDGDGTNIRFPGSKAATNIRTGAYSTHETVGIQLPHSRYKKRVSGVMTDFDPQDRTVLVQFLRKGNGAAIDGFKPYIELDSSGGELLRLELDDNSRLYVYINGGPGTQLGWVSSGERVQVTFTYDGTDFEFALAKWKNEVATNPETTLSLKATIGDVATYEFVRPSGGSKTRIGFHGLIDGDDGPANSAELLALAPVRLGTPMSQAEISAFDPT